MKHVQFYFDEYSKSHQNQINKMLHWVCVPLIFSTVIGFLCTFSLGGIVSQSVLEDEILRKNLLNLASVFLVFCLIFYFRLSKVLFLAMFLCSSSVYLLGIYLNENVEHFRIWCIGLFALAWVGQFIGHAFEGKKPSFVDDALFLLIGPIWILHFLLKKAGVPY